MTGAMWWAQVVVLSLLTLLACAKAVGSLGWTMMHDTPLMHYGAFLMERHGLFPYADFFVTDMPGTYLLHRLMVGAFGYGDLAFRWVDVVALGGVSVLTVATLRRFGGRVGWAAAVVFALLYLDLGRNQSLQRDYLGMIAVIVGIYLGSRTAARGLWRYAAIGVCFGVAATIKPHLVVGWPVVVGGAWWAAHESWRGVWKPFAVSAAGAAAIGVAALGWVASHGALDDLWTMATQYIPLHTSISGLNEVLPDDERWLQLLERASRMGGYGAILLCAVLGLGRVMRSSDPAIVVRARVLAVLLVAYGVYPAIAGKFWPYHFIPFLYCASLGAGLCLGRGDGDASGRGLGLIALVLAVTVQLSLPGYVRETVEDLAEPDGGKRVERIEEVAAWLREHLEEGDRVQPLDWARGGAVHAMLRAEARIATEFLYSYHFYHHVSHPFVQELRARFLQQMEQVQPRFVVDMRRIMHRVSGLDTVREFPALDGILRSRYRPVASGDRWVIYARRGG